MNAQWRTVGFIPGFLASAFTNESLTVAGSAFEAGTDNTAGVILWFLVAMLHNSAVLKRAQAELDEVLGADGDTAPCYEHLEQLPYCLALVKEVLR